MVVLLPPAGQLLGTLGFFEVFDAANRVLRHLGKPPAYELLLGGVGPSTDSGPGPRLHTVPADTLERAHTVVVGGATPMADAPIDPELVGAFGRLAEDAERVVGLCMGTFVLGELALLDGRRCTTHWLALDALRDRYPSAAVAGDVLYTEDPPIFTSAGGAAGVDLALRLVRTDLGQRLAMTVARTLVVFAPRSGDQSQYGSEVRVPPSADDRLTRLVEQIRRDPAGDHRVEVLAGRVGMSPRHFARVFQRQLGASPAAFVTRLRVEAAKRMLTQSDLPVATIGDQVGFPVEETFRRSFLRIVGVNPSVWRQSLSPR